jgi:hypothetical protein
VIVGSIQKLSRPDNLARIAAERFDYVVVDEVHHADAPTYRFERRAAQVELVDQFSMDLLLHRHTSGGPRPARTGPQGPCAARRDSMASPGGSPGTRRARASAARARRQCARRRLALKRDSSAAHEAAAQRLCPIWEVCEAARPSGLASAILAASVSRVFIAE